MADLSFHFAYEWRIKIPRSEEDKRGSMSTDDRKDHLRRGSSVSPGLSAFAGAISGLVARIATAPLDVVKIRLQLQTEGDKYRGIISTMKVIAREEGPFALWKGNVPASAMYVIYGGVQFSTYSMYNTWISELQERHGMTISAPAHSFILGSLAGCTSTLVSYPCDLLRTRFVSNTSFSRIGTTVRDILKNEGPLAMFKGVNAAMMSVSLYTGILFWSYESARIVSHSIGVFPFIVEPVCGFFAGAVSKGIVFPLDLIRKRLQVNTGKNKILVVAGFDIVRREGLRGLYKGFFVSLLKNAPTSALSIWTYEYVIRTVYKYNVLEYV